MHNSLDNINYIIQKCVEYNVKCWCADEHYDHSLKMLPLHGLTAAEMMATTISFDPYDMWGCEYKAHVHVRSYKNFCELNPKLERRIKSMIYHTDETSRYKTDKDSVNEERYTSLFDYMDDEQNKDTILMCLFKNENNHQLEDKEDKREKEDELIRTGELIGAVELYPSIMGVVYRNNETNKFTCDWNMFRDNYNKIIDEGHSEKRAYKEVSAMFNIWNKDCVDSICKLFTDYGCTHLNDRLFMNKLVQDFPVFACYCSDEDYEASERNDEKLKNFKKENLEKVNMYRL